MHNVTRYRIGRIIAILVTLFALTACERGTTPDSSASPPIRVAAYYWPGMYWLDIADRQGWFTEAGLNVERVDTNADYFASFDAFFAGKLDLIGFTQFDFILRNAHGQRAVSFLACDYSNGAEALIARPGITRINDLAGRKVGLSKGTYLEYIWETAAKNAGLKPGAVRIVDTSGEQAPELLARGEVDAILTWEPFATQGLTAVKGTRLFDTSQISGLSWSVYAAKPEFLAQRTAEMQALMRVWQRATQFIHENPDAAYAIVAEVNKKSLAEVRDFAAKDRVLNLRDNISAFSYAAGLDSLHGSTRQMNDFMAQRGLAAKRLETSALFDPRFVRALQQGNEKP